MEGGPPIFRQDFSCPALLKDPYTLSHTGLSPISPDFPDRSATDIRTTGLFRFRSPLLAESLLMSFPPGTEMFQFPGFASRTYLFSSGSASRRGLPHSDIHGSKPARGSPWLFAACHVLHRLLVPRHPPNALLIKHSSSCASAASSCQKQPKTTAATATMHRSKPGSGASRRASVIRNNRTPPAPPACFVYSRASEHRAGRELALTNSGQTTHHTLAPRDAQNPIHTANDQTRHTPNSADANGGHPPNGGRPDLYLLRSLRRAHYNGQQPGRLEANGFEPMTSCLQSRRSPS